MHKVGKMHEKKSIYSIKIEMIRFYNMSHNK